MKDKKDYVMFSLDPGSQTAGFAIVKYNIKNKKYHVVRAFTGSGKEYLKELKEIRKVHGDRVTRNIGYGFVFNEFLLKYKPDAVVSEEPHLRFLTAFRALIEQISIFRTYLYAYDPTMPYTLYKGSLVKGTLKVKGNSGDKELMLFGLLKRNDVTYDKSITPGELDEHQVDSIAVAITHIEKTLIKG
jgi:Holliday junction resolvasome RuvABC endonuclease subunit